MILGFVGGKCNKCGTLQFPKEKMCVNPECNAVDQMEDYEFAGKDGKTYFYRGAFCLEAQTFPDSPNQTQFPSPILRPGETYQQTTIYKLGVK